MHTTNFAPNLYALISEPTGSFLWYQELRGDTITLFGNPGIDPSLIKVQSKLSMAFINLFFPPMTLACLFIVVVVSFFFFEICLFLFYAYKGFA